MSRARPMPSAENPRPDGPASPYRRRILASSLSAAALTALGLPVAAADERVVTPRQSVGPFYPYGPEVERDADLVSVRGGSGLATGEITLLSGRLLDERGHPVRNARVEVWQCNAFGRYHHPRDRREAPVDPNFQGYGELVTRDDGGYRFRVIKPVPYPGRAPHIHFRVSGKDFGALATQMYIDGHPQNDDDFLLSSIVDPKARASLLVKFAAVPGSSELAVTFDIVLASNGTLKRG